MLPVSKHLTGSWMTAKMILRSTILHDRSHPKSLKLLNSSLWEAGLCAKEAIKEAENSPSTNLPALLGLSSFKYSRGNHHYTQPYKKRRVEQPRYMQSGYDYQYLTQNQGFRKPQPRKPQHISLPRKNQRNWQQHNSPVPNDNQEQKHQPFRGRNNNYNKTRSTRNFRRGNQRK